MHFVGECIYIRSLLVCALSKMIEPSIQVSTQCACRVRRLHSLFFTLKASVADCQEFIVAARVTEESRVDGQRTLASSCACAIQREVNVDVAVAREGNVAACRHSRVVSSIARRLEENDVRFGTRDLEQSVEAGVVKTKLLTALRHRNTSP